MKLGLKIILLIGSLWLITIPGQKISDDSLMKKARLEIYDNPDKTISIGNRLLKKEKDINKMISIYMLLSTANIAKRNFDESLKYSIKAKELAQKSNDLKIQTSALISVAIQYQQMELFSKSIETLNEADLYLSRLSDEMSEKHIETARSFAIRGMIYKSQSNSEIALEKFLISIQHFKKVEKMTYANMSVVYYNIGHCYLNLNQIEKAEHAFLEAADYAKKNHAKSLEAFALKGTAEVHKQKRENKMALELLTQAEQLGKNTRDLILNEGIYKEMADNYLAMGNQNLYQMYNKKQFEMRFEREQNELKSINQAIDNHNNETLKKSDELKKNYRYLKIIFISCALFIIGLLLSIIFNIRKENKKYHTEIQKMIRY
ncbi:hypothetical protein [Chryseobacterium sp. JUb7]|uniref:hypothetical protein n=1 Tax=Chryseobacterium sp. JUb7 TaxID=2940599 RepID=UPI0021694178|nr:hypothetical protein [Chryseobacterium sp. JUb7]MCS3531881.1 tetratricopeptide (TPR) repeat protein [Chryseobacterium sp. JUb7]